MGIGDWVLGIGDSGLGPIPNPQSPIPNPQSPIQNKFNNKLKSENINYYKFLSHLNFYLLILSSNYINVKTSSTNYL